MGIGAPNVTAGLSEVEGLTKIREEIPAEPIEA